MDNIITKYTTSGTYTYIPDFDGFITVECWGAGGGSYYDNNIETGGGGGGAYAKLLSYKVTGGQSYSLKVGRGTSYVNGEASYFVATNVVSADGGKAPTDRYGGGAGGQASNSVGDVKISGSAGALSGSAGGKGGDAANLSGGGGTGGAVPNGAGNRAGGGAGGNRQANGYADGYGAHGMVKITLTFEDNYGFKVWNGSAWDVKTVKVWNGSDWKVKRLKKYNGSEWV